MRRNALGLGLFLLLVTSVSAAAPAKTETVSFKSGDETISGYLATPAAAGRHPALVVIHEWWGPDDWVKGEAEEFAALGYVALAVGLYRRRVASDPETAHELRRGMAQERGGGGVGAAVD